MTIHEWLYGKALGEQAVATPPRPGERVEFAGNVHAFHRIETSRMLGGRVYRSTEQLHSALDYVDTFLVSPL